MKAILYHRYGGPEVLHLEEVPKPIPTDNEVLVKVHAAALNPYDWHFMRGKPRFTRFSSGLLAPKVKILGNDVAGVVEALGDQVEGIKVGDEITGSSGLGALAEYVCISQDRLVRKPSSMSMEESAGLNIAAITALEALRDNAMVRKGQHVLINGGSGGVGHYAIQIAKADGAEVTAVCSSRNIELVRSLGADHVIDYTRQSLISDTTYDAAVDAVGNLSAGLCKKLVKKNGHVAMVGFTGMRPLLSLLINKPFTKPKIHIVIISETAESLQQLVEMVNQKKLKTVVDRSYPLEKTAEAMDYLEQGHARGKVVISML